MADDGAKKGGYKFDYATTARAMCKGKLPYFSYNIALQPRQHGSIVVSTSKVSSGAWEKPKLSATRIYAIWEL